MPKRQLDALMWAQACAAMERAERLRRQFFHHATPHWEAPVDVFETERGADHPDRLARGRARHHHRHAERRRADRQGRAAVAARSWTMRAIVRMEIPHGHFERRIELPPVPFETVGPASCQWLPDAAPAKVG